MVSARLTRGGSVGRDFYLHTYIYIYVPAALQAGVQSEKLPLSWSYHVERASEFRAGLASVKGVRAGLRNL